MAATGGVNSPGGGCSVAPVTPGATQQTKNVLCYLYSQYGNHVLSGQQEANWNDNPTDISSYAGQGLKVPAVLGSDFAYHSSAGCTGVNISTTHAIAHWNAGGLVMYRYHAGVPTGTLTCAQDCYTGTNCSMSAPPSGFFTNVITAGTAENTSWKAKLDYVAIQIKAMGAAGLPPLLALFHETQSNGWFWWDKTTNATEFINLYKYTFNYLTQTKGLTNIVWIMPYSGSPTASFYPGKAYVDIGGGDTYGTNGPFASLYNSCKGIFGSTMPIPLHECGTAPLPSTMFPTTAPWVLFNVWAGYETSQWPNLKTIYADAHTVTRDEIPSLK
jgi:beta-mannanase